MASASCTPDPFSFFSFTCQLFFVGNSGELRRIPELDRLRINAASGSAAWRKFQGVAGRRVFCWFCCSSTTLNTTSSSTVVWWLAT